MNIRTLTPAEKTRLFSLICYGRGTPANIARAFDIDRRTAQRLTDEDHLADIIPKATALDLATWYAQLDPDFHTWTTADGIFHIEAKTAVTVRDDLAFLVIETVGKDLKRRMVEECPRLWKTVGGTGHQYAPARELREALDRDFTIPADIMHFFHHAKKPVFRDANGVEI